MANVQQLRKQIIKQRRKLSANTIRRDSLQMANHLCATKAFQQAIHIAYYLPVNGEADPTPLLKSAGHNKKFYLPVLKNNGETGLHFIRIDKNSEFVDNKFGIPEPVYSANNEMMPNQLDLVVTPLVSFDKQGNRIGMGGGFYDCSFAFKQTINKKREKLKPFLIGYAYEFQYSDQLKPEVWDVKLDGLVTENGFFHCQDT